MTHNLPRSTKSIKEELEDKRLQRLGYKSWPFLDFRHFEYNIEINEEIRRFLKENFTKNNHVISKIENSVVTRVYFRNEQDKLYTEMIFPKDEIIYEIENLEWQTDFSSTLQKEIDLEFIKNFKIQFDNLSPEDK